MMWRHVGIVRNGEDLRHALGEVRRLREEARSIGVSGGRKYNPEWCDAIILPHMLLACEAIIRSDFPKRDDANWLVNINVKKGEGGEMAVHRTPVAVTKMSPTWRAGDAHG